jgi:hypothetical protein
MSVRPISRRDLVVVGLLAIGLALSSLPADVSGGRPLAFPDLDTACAEGRPFLVTTCLPVGDRLGSQPSVVMFRDTPADAPQYTLATMGQVGAIWGLAFSHSGHAVYAGAFRKRQLALGPGGSGAIYRIDLTTGKISTFATVPDATDREPTIVGIDSTGAIQAGRTALGGIALSADEAELFVVNLFDRRIYRYDVGSGRLIGSFANGAATTTWANDARPFGLTVHDGRILHGVVNSAQSTQNPSELSAQVYSSLPDGADMRLAASFSLSYDRGKVGDVTGDCSGVFRCKYSTQSWRWQPWHDQVPALQEWFIYLVDPMPLVSDLQPMDGGALAITLRDRLGDIAFTDSIPPPSRPGGTGLFTFAGDILLGTPGGPGWDVATDPEPFDDGMTESDESGLGSVAADPSGRLVVMQHARTLRDPVQPAAIWYDAGSRQRVGMESVCKPGDRPRSPWAQVGRLAPLAWQDLAVKVAYADNEYSLWRVLDSVGDVEVLCAPPRGPDTPTPLADTPTATPSASPSPTPSPTTTANRSATPSATPPASRTPAPSPTTRPPPLWLPILLRESCTPLQRHVDVGLVIDASSSMLEPTATGRSKLAAAIAAAGTFLDQLHLDAGDQAAIVTFNSDATLLAPLTADRAALEAALTGITTAQYTRIDRGIAVARAELAGSRHRPANTPVMIVLTDGRANPVPVSAAEAEAQAAKDAGVVLFMVGLGQDLDTDALHRMASRPEYFFVAPDAEQLAGIYRSIAVAIPCPANAFWGRR